MATKVTYANLLSESRNNVVDIISANVSDPISSASEYRKWIYSRMPDVKDAAFKGYPLIIVEPSGIDIESEDSSGDGKHKFVSWTINIEVRTSDRGYGSADGQGLIQIDTISDSIMQQFLSMTHRNTLGANSMKFSAPTTEPVLTITEQNELIYRRIIGLRFRNLIPISA